MTLLTEAEVAEILRVSPRWVAEHSRPRSKQPLPFVKLGAHRRYVREEIEKFIVAGQNKPLGRAA